MAQTGSADAPPGHPPAHLHHQNPPRRPSFSPAEIDDALRVLPSHGWIAGWIGRRDRALLVLSQMAGLSYENIAELTVADIAVSEGTATIRTPGGTTILHRNDDDLICGPCALARWLHALDLTALYPSGAVVAAVIARAAPLTAQSPHLCEGTVAVMPTTRAVPVLPRTDQCGVRTRPSRSAPTPLIPEQGTNSRPPTVAGLFGSYRSSYFPATDHQTPDDARSLAFGLEGRARQLLDRHP